MTPARARRLLAADVANVRRDPTLAFVSVFALLPATLLALFRAKLDAAALQAVGLADCSRYVAPVALVLPAVLLGWVTGFLFLEERDDGPLLAIDVSPVGRTGLAAYRIGAAVLATGLVTAGGLVLVLDAPSPGLVGALGVLVSAEAVLAALVLPAIARNKVEGLALTKVTNLLALAPLLAAIPSPLRYLGGLVPTFWIGELLGVSAARYVSMPVALALTVVVHVGAMALCWRLFKARAG